jgi:hypothetical protein
MCWCASQHFFYTTLMWEVICYTIIIVRSILLLVHMFKRGIRAVLHILRVVRRPLYPPPLNNNDDTTNGVMIIKMKQLVKTSKKLQRSVHLEGGG